MEAEVLVKTTISSILSFRLVKTIEKMPDITFAKYIENDITKICFERNICWNIPVCIGHILVKLHWPTLDFY